MEFKTASTPGFHFIVLGCSGGPIESLTSCYLLKPPSVTFQEILSAGSNNCLISIDAGTGLSGLKKIISNRCCKNPFTELQRTLDLDSYSLSNRIINSISDYLITHPHLDHVNSLVINTPGFTCAKNVVGLRETTLALESNLFNDIVWPNMIKMGFLNIKSADKYSTLELNTYYKVKVFPVSHGVGYLSTAFLITDKLTRKSIISFGDVESDTTSGLNYNRCVWEFISPLIKEGSLNSIVIECSTVDKPPPLFGHMTPSTLFDEILTLRKILVDGNSVHNEDHYNNLPQQPLNGLNIVIVHVKESICGDPREQILTKLNELNYKFNTKVNFLMAKPGDFLNL